MKMSESNGLFGIGLGTLAAVILGNMVGFWYGVVLWLILLAIGAFTAEAANKVIEFLEERAKEEETKKRVSV